MKSYGRILTTDGWRYIVKCRDCGLVAAYHSLTSAQAEAQRHATTLRRGQYHHNVTVEETKS